MKIDWCDYNNRKAPEISEKIAQDLPPGRIVFIASDNGTDTKTGHLYRVVQHHPPNTRKVGVTYGEKKPYYNSHWQTTLVRILDVDLTQMKQKKARKANVSTALIFPADLITLCTVRNDIDRVIRDFVKETPTEFAEEKEDEDDV